ncbi:aspartate--tRNA ligase [Paracoccus subflavus]|uniref:Aspartate--tRNA(Asp/Asn) ligase n=1 Tax=Paracoccus subflavus TaxID=2528244 RepID=A0A4Q9FUZ6_9RHOB|nr:aspartate--tRNA ligase [Paracoccus subflavus]TBN36554.1 aspartate--tRNA ligase [Paracoccus subflavus]
MHAYRSHTCGDLTAAHAGETVRLSGWVHRVRDHGGVLFVDLRDHYGMTQVLADSDSPAFAAMDRLRAETVVRIDGRVKLRDASLVNAKLPTGEIEVYATEIEVLGPADELPLPVFGDQEYPEETRLAYRFLDLRRESLHDNIMLRSRVIRSIRNRMWDQGFTEFQTPIITASSPEGARDFLVPSRLHPGKFYALPQAPQQFKQLIMVAGFDRYFQIAPCFRDEDPRADRSPTDFYQLDMEMSFVEQEDVFATIQPVIQGVFEEFGTKPDGTHRPVDADWPRIPYAEALLKYGTDKPDLRNPIEMQVVSDHFRGSGFGIFAKLLEQDGIEIRAIPAPGGGSRKFADRMNAFAQAQGLPGMGYIFWRTGTNDEGLGSSEYEQFVAGIEQGDIPANLRQQIIESFRTSEPQKEALTKIQRLSSSGDALDKLEAKSLAERCFAYTRLEAAGPIAKALGPEKTEAIRTQLGLGEGDAVFFLGGKPEQFEAVAGRARTEIGRELGLIDENQFKFAWIVDFPMYEKTDDGRIDFSHNPFSMPQGGLEALNGDPLQVKGYQYDLACNGYELISGAIRNHKPEIMFKAFELAGYPASEVEKRFGGMVKAFRYGAPPHGGCAAGIDRIVMLLADEANIRQVIMFPMNQRAEDLMMGAPSEPTNEQLRELRLRVLPRE